MKHMTICMYGAASDNIDEEYFRQVELFGREIARHGHRLIYGGGGSGLMGASARGVRAEGGEVISVTPRFMEDYANLFEDRTQMIWTDTMSERKAIMEDRGDVFVIVPGGVGTYDEFFQILTLDTLKQKSSPIILFNIDGYFDTLINLLNESTERGFMHCNVWDYVTVADTVPEIMEGLPG